MKIVDNENFEEYNIEYQASSNEEVGELEKAVKDFFNMYSLSKKMLGLHDKSILSLLVKKEINLSGDNYGHLSISPMKPPCEISEIVLRKNPVKESKTLKVWQEGILIEDENRRYIVRFRPNKD